MKKKDRRGRRILRRKSISRRNTPERKATLTTLNQICGCPSAINRLTTRQLQQLLKDHVSLIPRRDGKTSYVTKAFKLLLKNFKKDLLNFHATAKQSLEPERLDLMFAIQETDPAFHSPHGDDLCACIISKFCPLRSQCQSESKKQRKKIEK